MSEILPLIDDGQTLFGGRSIILECEDNPSLIAHYEKHGFRLIETDDESLLKTMYLTPDFS